MTGAAPQDPQEEKILLHSFSFPREAQIDAAKPQILRLVKQVAHPGPGEGRQLCQVASDNGRPVPPDLRIVWQAHAGQGENSIEALTDVEQEAALELVNDGMLVPTANIDTPLSYKLTLLSHFDDVRWGFTKPKFWAIKDSDDQAPVIYTLSPNRQGADTITHLNAAHFPALERLTSYMGRGMTKTDSPIQLRTADGKKHKIKPIITDPDTVALRDRQRAYPIFSF